jgi:SAM-dependent methyltransferase
MTTVPATAVNRGVAPVGYFEERYPSRDWRFYTWILARIVSDSEPGPILDVGAGAAFLIEAAQRWGLDAEGIDGSEEAVAVARSRYPQARVHRQLLSERFPYEDESFQTAVLYQVIEHLEPGVAEYCLGEILRALRPGGTLFLASPNRFNQAEIRDDATHVHPYTPSELRELLIRAGFERLRPLDYPRTWPGTGRVSRVAAAGVFRLTGWDRLSASANSLAYKPS